MSKVPRPKGVDHEPMRRSRFKCNMDCAGAEVWTKEERTRGGVADMVIG